MNHPKLSGLQQQKFLLSHSQFCGWLSSGRQFLLRVFHEIALKWWLGLESSCGSHTNMSADDADHGWVGTSAEAGGGNTYICGFFMWSFHFLMAW